MADNIVGDIIKVSTAARPEVSGAVADDGGSLTDETSEANDSTADDMTLLPASPATGDAYYFGGYNEFSSLDLTISTAGAGTWSLVWEYYDGASWTALTNVTDGTADFTNSGTNTVSWDVPSDWEATSVSSIETYWVRARVDTFTDITTQPLGQEAEVQAVRTLVAVTRGEITLNSNVNVAETVLHEKKQMEKAPTNESWEVSFERLLQSTLGGLETLGLTDPTATPQVIKGYTETPPQYPDALEIDVEDEAGNTVQTLLVTDIRLVLEDVTITDDDFSAMTLGVHALERPRKIA